MPPLIYAKLKIFINVLCFYFFIFLPRMTAATLTVYHKMHRLPDGKR